MGKRRNIAEKFGQNPLEGRLSDEGNSGLASMYYIFYRWERGKIFPHTGNDFLVFNIK
jgi:hypothetical protein